MMNKRTVNLERVSKNDRIKEYIKETITNSTIHALPNIYTKKRTVYKIMWIFLFLISFAFNFRFLVRSIDDFLSYETITQIDIRTEQPGIFINIVLK
jgi:hypothetical protein